MTFWDSLRKRRYGPSVSPLRSRFTACRIVPSAAVAIFVPYRLLLCSRDSSTTWAQGDSRPARGIKTIRHRKKDGRQRDGHTSTVPFSVTCRENFSRLKKQTQSSQSQSQSQSQSASTAATDPPFIAAIVLFSKPADATATTPNNSINTSLMFIVDLQERGYLGNTTHLHILRCESVQTCNNNILPSLLKMTRDRGNLRRINKKNKMWRLSWGRDVANDLLMTDRKDPGDSGDIRSSQLRSFLFSPISIGMLVLFRASFGAAMVVESIRYVRYGWIDTQFVQPPLHFTYYGFSWVHPLPQQGMNGVFALLGISAAMTAIGLFYRVSTVLLFLTAAYVFLIEQALYLNHFYLIVLLSGILAVLPAHRAYSIDAWTRPGIRSWTVPAWTLWLLRFQVAVPYVFGGIAKLSADWFSGVPMQIMLLNRPEFPIIGQFFEQDWMVFLFAWGGALFDLFIVPLLLWRRTQVPAYIAVVLFHAINARLFNIGIFPLAMVTASLLFFPPEWVFGSQPSDADRQLPQTGSSTGWTSRRRWTAGLLGVHVLLQLVIPFRYLLYPGDVCWTEEGHRFSWRMKLRIKRATATFHAFDESGRPIEGIPQPSELLTARQLRLMTGRPDMVLQYGHFLAKRLRKDGHAGVRVTVDSMASLNGREAQPLIDPQANLAAIERNLKPASFIVPLEKLLPTLEQVRQRRQSALDDDESPVDR